MPNEIRTVGNCSCEVRYGKDIAKVRNVNALAGAAELIAELLNECHLQGHFILHPQSRFSGRGKRVTVTKWDKVFIWLSIQPGRSDSAWKYTLTSPKTLSSEQVASAIELHLNPQSKEQAEEEPGKGKNGFAHEDPVVFVETESTIKVEESHTHNLRDPEIAVAVCMTAFSLSNTPTRNDLLETLQHELECTENQAEKNLKILINNGFLQAHSQRGALVQYEAVGIFKTLLQSTGTFKKKERPAAPTEHLTPLPTKAALREAAAQAARGHQVTKLAPVVAAGEPLRNSAPIRAVTTPTLKSKVSDEIAELEKYAEAYQAAQEMAREGDERKAELQQAVLASQQAVRDAERAHKDAMRELAEAQKALAACENTDQETLRILSDQQYIGATQKLNNIKAFLNL